MSYQHFSLTVDQYVAKLSFNRPEKANSLNLAAWQEMKTAFEELSNNEDVRVIILAGEGKHFCAGMDLTTLMSIHGDSEKDAARKGKNIQAFITLIQDCISSIEKCKKPVVAAVHGGCIGGGLDIVTACDMRYCTEEAYFVIKETDLGLVADIGTLQRLPTIIQPGIMAEMAYTGRNVYGKEAAQIGLVNKVYSDRDTMLKMVEKLAVEIAEKSPLVIQGIKEMLLYKRDHSVKDSLHTMALYNAAYLLSSDSEEAFKAYVEKRKPKFEK